MWGEFSPAIFDVLYLSSFSQFSTEGGGENKVDIKEK